MPVEAVQAEALKDLVALAAQARGVEIGSIVNHPGAAGIPDEIPFGIVHGTTPTLVDLKPLFDKWRERPEAKRGTAKAATLAAFVALTNRHRTPHSVVFTDVDWRAPSLTTVVDYHEIELTPPELPAPMAAEVQIEKPEGGDPAILWLETSAPRPDWLRHRIHYDFPLSEAWKAWIDKDGEPMSQGEFAAWIEEHIQDLASPTPPEADAWGDLFQTTIAAPSSLISLSRGLKISVSSTLKNVVDLQSGASQLVFEEEHRDAGGDKLTVPGLFLLSVPPFVRGAPARVPVRLRYRQTSGRLVWFYQIFRPDDVISVAVDAAIEKVRAETTLPVYEGAPEA